MSTINLRLFEFARKEMSLSEEKAKEFVLAIKEVVKQAKNEITKEDKKVENLDELTTNAYVKDEIHRLELSTYKAIFWAGLIQFLAIVGSLIGIISFMFHK